MALDNAKKYPKLVQSSKFSSMAIFIGPKFDHCLGLSVTDLVDTGLMRSWHVKINSAFPKVTQLPFSTESKANQLMKFGSKFEANVLLRLWS